jgi:hypothetical protein
MMLFMETLSSLSSPLTYQIFLFCVSPFFFSIGFSLSAKNHVQINANSILYLIFVH